MKTISFLDNTSRHLPHLMSKADREDLTHDKIILTDECVTAKVTNKIKVAWLIEPAQIKCNPYEYVYFFPHKFDLILTHNIFLINSLPNAVFMPFGTTFLESNEFRLYEKSKDISMFVSGKAFTTGHRFRNYLAEKLIGKVDIFGRLINPVDSKLVGLKDYKYNIVVENELTNFWFTEKLLDCFLTGTLPVYYGCPEIGRFFDIDGIIQFTTEEEFNKILPTLTEELYLSKMNAIKKNFEEAKKYLNPYDVVYDLVEAI